MKVWSLCASVSTRGYNYLTQVITGEDHLISDADKRKTGLRGSTKTKAKTYVSLNPDLTVHPMYGHTTIPEYHRIAVTRLRLSSHNLAIETGRWSRTPPDDRLCRCGLVQNEDHVICKCEDTAHVRIAHDMTNYDSLTNLFYHGNMEAMCSMIYQCMNVVASNQ